MRRFAVDPALILAFPILVAPRNAIAAATANARNPGEQGRSRRDEGLERRLRRIDAVRCQTGCDGARERQRKRCCAATPSRHRRARDDARRPTREPRRCRAVSRARKGRRWRPLPRCADARRARSPSARPRVRSHRCVLRPRTKWPRDSTRWWRRSVSVARARRRTPGMPAGCRGAAPPTSDAQRVELRERSQRCERRNDERANATKAGP